MHRRPIVLFIILDAFRWDYLTTEDAPFLSQLARGGLHVRQLTSTAGFTQRSAIFCGAPPDRTGNFTMFTFEPGQSPFEFTRPFARALRPISWYIRKGLPGRGKLNALVRYRWIERAARRRVTHAPPGWIPLDALHWFSVSEDVRPVWQPGAFTAESIFDVMASARRPYAYFLYPVVDGDDAAALEAASRAVSDGSDLYLVQFSDADGVCHRFGTAGTERRQTVQALDRKLVRLADAFGTTGRPLRWVIVGDHGMTDVRSELDVAALVASAAPGLRHGRDYVLFLDSTMVRLWALTERGRALLPAVSGMSALRNAGTFVTEDLAGAKRIPRDRRYGDLLWWAHPGVLVRPDYFHDPREVVRGMHGYDSTHPDMLGTAVIAGDGLRGVRPRGELVDVCPTLCELLDLRTPRHSEGMSWLR